MCSGHFIKHDSSCTSRVANKEPKKALPTRKIKVPQAGFDTAAGLAKFSMLQLLIF